MVYNYSMLIYSSENWRDFTQDVSRHLHLSYLVCLILLLPVVNYKYFEYIKVKLYNVKRRKFVVFTLFTRTVLKFIDVEYQWTRMITNDNIRFE